MNLFNSETAQSLKDPLAAGNKKHIEERDRTRLETEDLYQTLDVRREQFGLSWRQVAIQSEVSSSVLIRMAQGITPDTESLERLKKWVFSRSGLWVRL